MFLVFRGGSVEIHVFMYFNVFFPWDPGRGFHPVLSGPVNIWNVHSRTGARSNNIHIQQKEEGGRRRGEVPRSGGGK